MRAAQFTPRFEIVNIEDVNVFTSRILIGVSVCVVASVEYDEVVLASRIRMSTRNIIFFQKSWDHQQNGRPGLFVCLSLNNCEMTLRTWIDLGARCC